MGWSSEKCISHAAVRERRPDFPRRIVRDLATARFCTRPLASARTARTPLTARAIPADIRLIGLVDFHSSPDSNLRGPGRADTPVSAVRNDGYRQKIRIDAGTSAYAKNRMFVILARPSDTNMPI